MQILELCIFCIFGRASGLQKLKKLKKLEENEKCQKKIKFWNCAFFAFLGGPPVRAPKVQKIPKTRGKCKKKCPPTKNNAKKMRKKCKFWNCACLVKTQISRSCICFCIVDCMFFAFSWATVLGLHFLGACFCIFGILIKFYHL